MENGTEDGGDKLHSLEGTHFCVALSGGADSISVFLALYYLQTRLGIELSAVHIHHGLRSEADDEAMTVMRFCAQLGVQCSIHHVNVCADAESKGIGIEEAGRVARYAHFANLVEQIPETWIALGHHADDLCEDVLMRLIRGAGWPALGGMVGLDSTRKIIRPLLGTSRADIEKFLNLLGLTWIEDASNASMEYKRNRIRHNIMPHLLAENPALHETILSLWKLARIDADFWQKRLHATLEENPSSQVLDRRILQSLTQAERLRLYKMKLDKLGTGQASVITLLALDTAWQQQRGGVSFQFSGHKIASISRGSITFTRLLTME